MRQVKSYAELLSYNEITSFVEAERVVSSFVATETNIAIIKRMIVDLTAARQSDHGTQLPALQVLTGPRGAGKSHLLAFLRAVIGSKSLRNIIQDSGILKAMAAYQDKPVVALDLTFDVDENITFEAKLRKALCETLQNANYFDDGKWAEAVRCEQVFEQAFGALPLGSQLVVFIDNLPNRWNLLPETVEGDLEWLALIERQSVSFPLRVIVVRDEDPESYGQNDPGVYHLPIQNMCEVISKRVIKKSGSQITELEALFGELLQQLPSFSWSKSDFVECYPVHPVVMELASAFRTASLGFSLISFTSAAIPRTLSRPALSLIALDEVFDRFEYEFRKNNSLLPAFKLYDQVVSSTISKLPVSERLWAKLVLKSLFAFSVAGLNVTAEQIANAQMLTVDGQPGAGYERVASILRHFCETCPDAVVPKSEGAATTFVLASVTQTLPTKIESQVSRASREIPAHDEDLRDLLICTGLQIYTQFDGSPLIAHGTTSMPPRMTQQFAWWGDTFSADLCFRGLLEGDQIRKLAVKPFSLAGAEGPPDAGPTDPMTVIWAPALVPGLARIASLRKLLALNHIAEERLKQGGEITDDMISLHDRLTSEVRELFGDVYLKHGQFFDSYGPEPLDIGQLQEPEAGDSISALLATTFDRVLTRQYPSHPRFLEPFSITDAQRIIRCFFAGNDEEKRDPEVTELVRKFAVPLGLVTNTADEGTTPHYELDIFSENAQRYPYIQTVLGCLDQLTDETGLANVSLSYLEDRLFSAPYGLSLAAQHLVLGALLATNLIELYNETADSMLSQKGLATGFDTADYSVVRRTSAVSYPVTVLAEWARTLTGDQSLPVPQTMDCEKKVRESLNDWLRNWEEMNLSARFEQVPNEMMTVGSWRTLDSNRRRFARVAAFARASAEGRMDVTTTLSRITDVFGFDRSALVRIQTEMHNLSGFLDWVPTFTEIRNYLLASEPTSRPDIDHLRTSLSEVTQNAFTLLPPGAREEFEAKFVEFREKFTEYYAALHESNVGPTANQELIAKFCVSEDWTRFRLLMDLKIEGGAFERDSQSLFKLAQETRCDLPVRELLQHQPHCCCSFRLHRRVHLDSLLDALKAIAGAASTFYSLAIWRHRSDLRNRARELGDETFAAELENFLTACGSGDLSEMNSTLVRFINEALVTEAPQISTGASLHR